MIQRFFALATIVTFAAQVSAQDLSVSPIRDGVLEFRDGDKLVTRYHHKGFAKPIFFPVHAPNGAALTRVWPMLDTEAKRSDDHPWQKSAWFCWGDVVAEGVKLKNTRKGIVGTDYWSDGLKACGKIVCTKVEVKKSDKNHLTVATTNEWISADGDKKILDETRLIHLVRPKAAWIVVVESDLSSAEYDIVFDDTKEGAMGIRINDQITGKSGKGKIENAEGKIGEKECWGRLSAWCDYSGPIDGKVAGLTILADPKNPHPSCWHVRDYGLMAANPFGRAKSGFSAMKGRTDVVRLGKGEHIRFRYGMLLHDGDVAAGRVAENFQTFADLRKE